jgi:flagellar biosynthesis/type III secretory pathway M-ring protein FliF/YscJ
METVLNPDFWSDQMASALKAWAIFIPFILVFFTAFKIIAKLKKENRGLRAQAEAVESRLQLAREANYGEAKTIAEFRTEIDGLRQLFGAGTEPSVVKPIIKEMDAWAAALATANRTTDHILTAEKPAIGGT